MSKLPEVGDHRPVPAGPAFAEAHAISRRRFIIQMDGLVAAIIVVGAGVGEVLRAQAGPKPQIVKAPVLFPNTAGYWMTRGSVAPLIGLGVLRRPGVWQGGVALIGVGCAGPRLSAQPIPIRPAQ